MLRVKSLNKVLIVFSYISVTAVIFVLAFSLLRFPEVAGEGVKKGIELSLYTLIPSMFPFMFLSSFIVSSGICSKLEKAFSLAMKKLFRLPGVCGSLIILSMIGGLPIGARMAGELYDKKYITQKQGQRLLLFCINPGPAFVISTVGYYMLGSKKVGCIIFISVVASSITIGFLSKFLFNDELTEVLSKKSDSKLDIQGAIVSSVSESSRGMMNICSWVILFSCFSELLGLLPFSNGTKLFVYSIIEITNGCKNASAILPMPAVAGVIGFSGICAHMQIMPSIVKMKLPLKYFLSARIINSVLSILISSVLFDLFPVSVNTISMGSLPENIETNISLPISVGVMAMSVLFLLGENFRIRKNQILSTKKDF